MHFSPDRFDETQIEWLEAFVRILRQSIHARETAYDPDTWLRRPQHAAGLHPSRDRSFGSQSKSDARREAPTPVNIGPSHRDAAGRCHRCIPRGDHARDQAGDLAIGVPDTGAGTVARLATASNGAPAMLLD